MGLSVSHVSVGPEAVAERGGPSEHHHRASREGSPIRCVARWWCMALALAMMAVPVAAATPVRAPGIRPPVVNPGALVPEPPSGPPEPTEQRSVCAHPVWSGRPPNGTPAPQEALDLPQAWQFANGAGQTVAVIDTGVARHPRLHTLIPGGDFVSNTDGTVDCDGHGTLVAGIIAAAPDPDDGFSGVAPGAAIVSIRQESAAYQARNFSSGRGPGQTSAGGYGNVLTLAYAVVRAVRMHATVINISEVACAQAGTSMNDGPLGAAVKYAYDHNVVVVTAAGNVESDGNCQKQNNGTGWGATTTVASPAWFVPYVLPVASVDANGAPSQFSLHGPWVQVAAPGRNIVSLNSIPGSRGLVNGIPRNDGGTSTIDGTSFASAYVAGLVALVRQRFPTLTAQQVMDRIVRTAHAPGTGRDDRIGTGMIDPAAALTAQLPNGLPTAQSDFGRRVHAPVTSGNAGASARRIAVIGSVLALSALVGGVAVSIPFRRERRRKLTEDVDY